MLIDIVIVVVDQKLITANDSMREPGVCIVLKNSPVDQFHNLISPYSEPLTNVCEFNKSTEFRIVPV